MILAIKVKATIELMEEKIEEVKQQNKEANIVKSIEQNLKKQQASNNNNLNNNNYKKSKEEEVEEYEEGEEAGKLVRRDSKSKTADYNP